jgi:acetone carboxylase gamma subunit
MKSKTTQGLGNKNVLSFPKHDSLKYWRLKSNVNSRMSIQYVNQAESLSWSFSDLSGGKWCLQRKYICADNMTL